MKNIAKFDIIITDTEVEALLLESRLIKQYKPKYNLDLKHNERYAYIKITTEEYVRDDRFEVIGVGVKVDDGETEWYSGTEAQTKFWLQKFDWANSLVLAHSPEQTEYRHQKLYR